MTYAGVPNRSAISRSEHPPTWRSSPVMAADGGKSERSGTTGTSGGERQGGSSPLSAKHSRDRTRTHCRRPGPPTSDPTETLANAALYRVVLSGAVLYAVLRVTCRL